MKALLVLLLTGAIASHLSAAEKRKSSARSLTAIPGIEETIEAKLNAAGINNVNDLLAEGTTPQGRREIAARSGLAVEQIFKFVNYADIFRIEGIAGPAAALLASAGVDTLADLAQNSASNLHAKLQQVSAAKKVKGKAPTETEVAAWIEAAKTLPKLVSP